MRFFFSLSSALYLRAFEFCQSPKAKRSYYAKIVAISAKGKTNSDNPEMFYLDLAPNPRFGCPSATAGSTDPFNPIFCRENKRKHDHMWPSVPEKNENMQIPGEGRVGLCV